MNAQEQQQEKEIFFEQTKDYYDKNKIPGLKKNIKDMPDNYKEKQYITPWLLDSQKKQKKRLVKGLGGLNSRKQSKNTQDKKVEAVQTNISYYDPQTPYENKELLQDKQRIKKNNKLDDYDSFYSQLLRKKLMNDLIHQKEGDDKQYFPIEIISSTALNDLRQQQRKINPGFLRYDELSQEFFLNETQLQPSNTLRENFTLKYPDFYAETTENEEDENLEIQKIKIIEKDSSGHKNQINLSEKNKLNQNNLKLPNSNNKSINFNQLSQQVAEEQSHKNSFIFQQSRKSSHRIASFDKYKISKTQKISQMEEYPNSKNNMNKTEHHENSKFFIKNQDFRYKNNKSVFCEPNNPNINSNFQYKQMNLNNENQLNQSYQYRQTTQNQIDTQPINLKVALQFSQQPQNYFMYQFPQKKYSQQNNEKSYEYYKTSQKRNHSNEMKTDIQQINNQQQLENQINNKYNQNQSRNIVKNILHDKKEKFFSENPDLEQKGYTKYKKKLRAYSQNSEKQKFIQERQQFFKEILQN